MKEFIITPNDAGQRLDRWLAKAIPTLTTGTLQKSLRRKRIRCNGKVAKGELRLTTGDILHLYINDEFFETPTREEGYLTITTPKLTILYEDDHIILVDKPAGQLVHADEEGESNTTISHIQAYLYQKGEWKPEEEHSFSPSLCNRIDRNTGGIVISAKSAEGLRIMNEKIRDRQMKKEYLCIVHGTLKQKRGELTHFLVRDLERKQVSVFDRPCPNGKTATTLYTVLAESEELSLLSCTLITGRTHQIRAQFAHIGHPLLGDGKYGSLKQNKKFGRTIQALYSYRLTFEFTGESGCLQGLNGKVVTAEKVDFVSEFFPDYPKKKKI
ncbi:MAG: RluA family pseudouridine synthase [Eubacteriales bacterium]